MVAKYFQPNTFLNSPHSMVVYYSRRYLHTDDSIADYDAVYSPEDDVFGIPVLTTPGNEFNDLKSRVLADYPGCQIVT